MVDIVRKNKPLLVVDDCISFTLWLEMQLSNKGICVAQCSSLKDALHHLDDFDRQFAGAIIDRELGQEDGLDLVVQLRAVSDLPIVVASADASDFVIEAATYAGADAVLEKPFQLERLIKALQLTSSGSDPSCDNEEAALARAYHCHLIQELKSTSPHDDPQKLLSLLHRLKGTSALYGYSALSQSLRAYFTALRDRHKSRNQVVAGLHGLALNLEESGFPA